MVSEVRHRVKENLSATFRRSFWPHIITLRILSRCYFGADRLADLPALMNPDWRSTPKGLWLYELLGIHATKYPAVLESEAAAEYATPKRFANRVASRMLSTEDVMRNLWYLQWRALVTADVERDPRYVAYRTMHDWIVLCAKVLAERCAAADREVPGPLQHGAPAQRDRVHYAG